MAMLLCPFRAVFEQEARQDGIAAEHREIERDASQSPPRTAIGQPSRTISFTTSSAPAAAMSGNRRNCGG